MAHYYHDEYADMIRMYYINGEQANVAAEPYAEAYPNRRLPDANVITGAIRRLRETGNVMPRGIDAGHPRNVRTPANIEITLDMVDADPTTSTRSIANETGISKSQVNVILREEGIHPYHYTKVQRLLPQDYLNRVNFSRQLLRRINAEPLFHRRILWTDECTFTQDGIFNCHNYHHYSRENPFLVWETRSQFRFTINVWAGVIGDQCIGPIFFPERLDGDFYHHFIRDVLPGILFPPNEMDDMPLNRRRIVFMHDGCPAHYAAPVRRYLNDNYGDDWIGRGAPVWRWPARSPDLNPCDYYLWGALKERLYLNRVRDEDELRDSIEVVFGDINRNHILNATNAITTRAHCCIEAGGGHIENMR